MGNQSIEFYGRIAGNGNKPVMIAEEGQANQGDINLAFEMCRLAKNADADGIEFQLFFADDMYIVADPSHSLYRNRELDLSAIKDLIKFSHECDLAFQATGLSPKIIQYCAENDADVFCINATDLNNPQIIDAVIATGKPFWVATLMASLEEIDWLVEYILKKNGVNFGLLHGQHVMTSSDGGVPPDLLQLDCISLMKKRYELPIGFVDHTSTQIVPALAAMKGADIVTKHIAPCVNWNGPDYKIALAPEEWRASKHILDYAWQATGESKEISFQERIDRELHRRSIYAAVSMPAGHIIESSDLIALRPGAGGTSPACIHSLVGAIVLNEIPRQSQIKLDDLEVTGKG